MNHRSMNHHTSSQELSSEMSIWYPIVHFTVACLVTWAMNESEAGVDLVLIETLHLTAFLMQILTN